VALRIGGVVVAVALAVMSGIAFAGGHQVRGAAYALAGAVVGVLSFVRARPSVVVEVVLEWLGHWI
jgi:hypothetical protein